MLINNKSELLEYRRNLRNHMTKEEIILWSKIKQKQLNGFKFRRQNSINNFIIDFYCPEKKLGIELYGSQHFQDEKMKYDEERTNYLKSLGIIIVRFSNFDINNNLNGVLESILINLK